MAVETRETETAGPRLESRTSQASPARRFLVGTNVVVATLFVAGIVVVAQLMAYSLPKRWDMTSTGVNSLSEASENVLRSLDQNIRLTSLYFETDREEKDQPRYRRAAQDLLDLYEATNRAKVGSEWINPLKDHEQFRKLLARLREKAAFKEEIEQYKARIDRYTGELSDEMQAMVQSEPKKALTRPIRSSTTGSSGETESRRQGCPTTRDNPTDGASKRRPRYDRLSTGAFVFHQRLERRSPCLLKPNQPSA